MYELILNYLPSVYWVSSLQVLEHGSDTAIYGDELRDEIVEMFDVSQLIATACIEIWLYDESPTFDTEKWWDEKRNWWENSHRGDFETLLPIAQRVAAQTVGLDLVAVQPMELPTGLLTYMDFVDHTQSAMTQQMGIPPDRFGQDHPVQVGVPDTTLIGHKGRTIMEAGYVYAPYIPMTILSGITHP